MTIARRVDTVLLDKMLQLLFRVDHAIDNFKRAQAHRLFLLGLLSDHTFRTSSSTCDEQRNSPVRMSFSS